MNNVKHRILIGEDNVLIAEHLKDILLDFGYEVVAMFHHKKAIIEGIQTHQPDLILLDIKMETEFTGVEIGNYVAQNYNIPFIYITAHSERTTLEKALKSKPAGYILKPFKAIEIEIAIKLAIEKSEKQNAYDAVTIKDGFVSYKLFYNEILFLKSDNNYVEIQTKSNKYVVRNSLKNILKDLDPDRFIQPHRSYLVNVTFAVKYVNKTLFILNYPIPVSRKHSEIVTAIFT